MSHFIIIFLLLFSINSFSQTSNPLTHNLPNTQRCSEHYLNTNELFMNEFKWGFSLESMAKKFDDIYNSGKRIQMHANYDQEEKSFVLYHGSYDQPKKIKITENFINSIRIHIEMSLVNNFSEFVFFPDMGHSHLYFHQDYWDQNYSGKYPVAKADKQFEAMFADPNLKVLYHLTEQLEMVDENKNPLDSILEFKYLNRNFMAQNNQSYEYEIHTQMDKKQYNTVGEIHGYTRWGQGFAISASREGCFAYKDKLGNLKYFDISIYDPRYDPNQISRDELGY